MSLMVDVDKDMNDHHKTLIYISIFYLYHKWPILKSIHPNPAVYLYTLGYKLYHSSCLLCPSDSAE